MCWVYWVLNAWVYTCTINRLNFPITSHPCQCKLMSKLISTHSSSAEASSHQSQTYWAEQRVETMRCCVRKKLFSCKMHGMQRCAALLASNNIHFHVHTKKRLCSLNLIRLGRKLKMRKENTEQRWESEQRDNVLMFTRVDIAHVPERASLSRSQLLLSMRMFCVFSCAKSSLAILDIETHKRKSKTLIRRARFLVKWRNKKRKFGRKIVFKFTQVVASSLTSFTIRLDSLARTSQSLATSIKITRKKKRFAWIPFCVFLSLIFRVRGRKDYKF